MSITTHSEDLLPEIQTQVPVNLAAQALELDLEAEGSAEAIARDISGCISLIGPVAVCYSVNVNIPSASISLKVGPVVIVSGEISPARPCLTLKGSYGVAKWDLNICLRVPQKAITLEGTVCVSLLGCKSFNITLFQWGADDLDAPEAAGYPAYQCFKTEDRQVYASSFKVKNHAEGNGWIKAATTHFNVRVNGRPFTSDKIPPGAITYPNRVADGDPAATGDDLALALGSTRISVKTQSADSSACSYIMINDRMLRCTKPAVEAAIKRAAESPTNVDTFKAAARETYFIGQVSGWGWSWPGDNLDKEAYKNYILQALRGCLNPLDRFYVAEGSLLLIRDKADTIVRLLTPNV